MKFAKSAVIAVLFATTCALACINGYEDGTNHLIDKPDAKEVALALERLEDSYKRIPTAEVANDLAVVLLLAANAPRAVDILTRLEQEKPGLAKTASNLGTALELSGRNKEALQRIQEGIKRNPADHEGTEWLHVKILEAKIAIEADPGWLKTHSVLGVRFGSEDFPQKPSQGPIDFQGQSHSLLDAQRAISYQLRERLKFVSPPDALVADLFATLGNIAYILGDGSPIVDYEKAIGFGVADVPAIERRILYVETHPWGVSIVIWMLLAGSTISGLVYCLWTWRRGRQIKLGEART